MSDLTEAEYTVADGLVPVEGGTITVRAITPYVETSGVGLPALVWIHGGGE